MTEDTQIELRKFALELASTDTPSEFIIHANKKTGSAESVVERAQAYYNFLKGEDNG